MKINQSEEYEELGAEFQFQMIEILNQALKKHGVKEDIRKEICGDFTFNFSMLLDQGEIKDHLPMVVFEKEENIFFPNEEFEYHEYAFGNVDELFDSE